MPITEQEAQAGAAPRESKTAVVLSGGGANGAYEVGILKALFSGKSPTTGYQPLQPDIFCGTSIGSFNAAFLVSQWETFGTSAVSNLEQMWLERLAGSWHDNGVFRLLGNPLDLLHPQEIFSDPLSRTFKGIQEVGALAWEALQRGVSVATSRQGSIEQRLMEAFNLSSLISTEPMEQMLGSLDYEGIRRSTKWLKIAATNWSTGQLRVFWNHDMTNSFGPLAIRASGSLPGFFPPVHWGAQPYYDGSVLQNTPLSPAIHAGADILHVIYLDPEVTAIPFPPLQNTYDTILRMMQIKWAETYNDDIGDAARINRGLAAVEAVRRGEPPAGSKTDFLRAVGDLTDTFEGLRPLTIYRYHPRDPLEGHMGLLNFERDRLEALIQRGFEDAVYHDSADSGDVFPDAEMPPKNSRTAR